MTDSRQWCETLFATIDAKNSREFAAYLSADAQFRFGGAPPVAGTAAVIRSLDEFFSGIAALSHRICDVWEFSEHRICRGEVRYRRLDGKEVSTPFCNVFTMRDGKISCYDIYVDPTPLVTP